MSGAGAAGELVVVEQQLEVELLVVGVRRDELAQPRVRRSPMFAHRLAHPQAALRTCGIQSSIQRT